MLWNVKTVTELFCVSPQDKVPDDEIIARCESEGYSWITPDLKARKRHRVALAMHEINVLFVRRPDAGMSRQYTLAVLSNAIRQFDMLLADEPEKVTRCEVGWSLPSCLTNIERRVRGGDAT